MKFSSSSSLLSIRSFGTTTTAAAAAVLLSIISLFTLMDLIIGVDAIHDNIIITSEKLNGANIFQTKSSHPHNQRRSLQVNNNNEVAETFEEGTCDLTSSTTSTCCAAHEILHSTNNTLRHKNVYKVGVLAIRGFESAYNEFNKTFADYLTKSVSSKFMGKGNNIRFELKPLNFISLFRDVETKKIDFIYVNPSAYACIEAEHGSNSLVSQISLRKVGGKQYSLTKFGGVIMALSNNTSIQTIGDLKNKKIAAASISGLGSGQMQFRKLSTNGMSYINDPSQVVFTSNQGKVVNGVLYGEFDVGFVRTDQMERTKDRVTKKLVNTSLFKVIEPLSDLSIDGVPFPFQSSTQLYPEWNVASLPWVPDNIAREVQQSLLNLENQANIGYALKDCYENRKCSDNTLCYERCNEDVMSIQNYTFPCDTSPSLAITAMEAKTAGRFVGFRSTLSYMELRNMQEDTGFIRQIDDDENGQRSYQCIRSSRIYDAIVCPKGYIKQNEQSVLNGCASKGIPCGKGYQCVCKPCMRAFDVDVFPAKKVSNNKNDNGAGQSNSNNNETLSSYEACEKMDICATTEQLSPVTFRFVDNRKRDNVKFEVRFFQGNDERYTLLPVIPLQQNNTDNTTNPNNNNNYYEYEFGPLESSALGISIIEILADGEQISQSPFRVAIEERNCVREYGDELLIADETGNCICTDFSVKVFGGENNCVRYGVLLPTILVPLLVVVMVVGYMYIEYKRKKHDSIWRVKRNELVFDNPAVVVGRGTFGLVLLAVYRGTTVAVKRVIPPKEKSNKPIKGSGGGGESCEILGKGDAAEVGCREKLTNEIKVSELMDPERLDALRSDSRDEGENGSSDGDDTYIADIKVGLQVRRTSLDHNKSFKNDIVITNTSIGIQVRRTSLDNNKTFSNNNNKEDDNIGNSSLSMNGAGNTSSNVGSGGFDYSKSGNFTAFAANNNNKNASLTSTGTVIKSGSIYKSTTWWKNGFFGKVCCGPRRDEYSKLKADFVVEMRQLSKLRHPCITTVMGAVIDRGEEPMLVMEFMELGSLYDLLHNESMLIEGEIIHPIIKDVVQGLRFLHSNEPPVIHGDLKSQNILVDSKLRAKVADFGLSQKKRVGATGTPFWMAPELLTGKSVNTVGSDCYSFGIMLYEIYSRKNPYEGEDPQLVLQQVCDSKINKRPPIPSTCPSSISSMMTECTNADPNLRPKLEEIDIRLKRLDTDSIDPGMNVISMQISKQSSAKKSERLLLEVFPEKIANALREGKKIEPEYHDIVTIYFSDIVGFTNISALLTPIQVSSLLDRLYLKFDELSRKHDVFKIETIGDAYMAVTNLVKIQEDHVKRIANFSKDAINAASTTLIDEDRPELGYVQIRVGFHSGPVVSNVVGSRNPKFTIIGDTVNAASRMESNSLPLQIQCSERSALLLLDMHPDIPCTLRGKIRVKGKGEMTTYWVHQKEQQQPSLPTSYAQNNNNKSKKKKTQKARFVDTPNNQYIVPLK